MKIVKDLGLINQGGFGVIHKVQLEDGSLVARKTFHPIVATKIDADTRKKLIKRFIREVKIQEQLPSELFIPILFSNLEGENPWFLMPIADKVYHAEMNNGNINSCNPDGLADILNSLEHLHDLGLVHRDLKPGNILFHEGRWKLADLGLITSNTDITTSFCTSENFGAGSVPYMAPEQVINFHGVTRHADIYSFGAILHDLFNGATRIPYKKLTADGPIGVIIEKCTEERIDKRFDNIKILRDILLGHLSKKVISIDIDVDTIEWIDKIKNIDTWTSLDFDSLVIYLEKEDDSKEIIFREVTIDIIQKLHKLDFQLWKQFVIMYFEWVYSKAFDFGYCDAISGHIFEAYSLSGDLEIKSRAAITVAELGKSHNRYYVMRILGRMCSEVIDDNLAQRISIEIHIEGQRARTNFIESVKKINRSIASYHQLIKDALS
jgi:serine/threonine protein kinase